MDNPGRKGRGEWGVDKHSRLGAPLPTFGFCAHRLLGLAVNHFCQRTGCQCVPFERHARCMGILVGSIKESK